MKILTANPVYTTAKIITVLLTMLFGGALYSQNAPVSTIRSSADTLDHTTITIEAFNFQNVISFDLAFTYNTAVATPVSVQMGSDLPGFLNSNLTTPGSINTGWYNSAAVYLTDTVEILKITFQRNAPGEINLQWFDNGYSCNFTNALFQPLNDLPTASFYHTGANIFQLPEAPSIALSHITATPGQTVSFPALVTNFTMISAFVLTLQFDPAALQISEIINESNFPAFTWSQPAPGYITVSGSVPSGEYYQTLPDNALLFSLSGEYINGSTTISWITGQSTCRFHGAHPSEFILNDTPYSDHYLNGSVTGTTLPSPAGPVNGPAQFCAATTAEYYIDPIANAETYQWIVPGNTKILWGQGTNHIAIQSYPSFTSGTLTVYGINQNGNGHPSHKQTSSLSGPYIINQPEPDTLILNSNDTATFRVNANGTALQYQWQLLQQDWTNLTDDQFYSGTTTNTLTITSLPYSENPLYFRCLLTDTCNIQLTSGSATLTTVLPTGIQTPTHFKKTFHLYPNPFIDIINIITINNLSAIGPIPNKIPLSPIDPLPANFQTEILNTSGQTVYRGTSAILHLHFLPSNSNKIQHRNLQNHQEMKMLRWAV